MEHVRSVAVGVWVETGSRHEPESRGGMSHLIEHLVFKGTAACTAEALIHDLFAAQIWEGHPLGRPILGTREAVTGYGRDTVLSHFGEEYVPPRIMIAVAGNATHARVVDLFGAHFDGFQRAPVAR